MQKRSAALPRSRAAASHSSGGSGGACAHLGRGVKRGGVEARELVSLQWNWPQGAGHGNCKWPNSADSVLVPPSSVHAMLNSGSRVWKEQAVHVGQPDEV